MPGDRPAPPIDEQWLLDRAGALGVRLVQVGDNWPLHELPAERINALRQRVDWEGMTLEVGSRGLTDANLERYLHLAHGLNSRLLRFVIDEAAYEPGVDAVVSLLRNALPALERAKVTLALENHDRLLARQFANIVEGVGSANVGICLDSVNSMGRAKAWRR